MTTRDLFGLAVRLLGLYMLWISVNLILAMFFGDMPLLFGVLLWQAFIFIAGLWLLRGAPQLVDYAYPPDRDGGPYGAASRGPSPFGGTVSSARTDSTAGDTPPRDDPRTDPHRQDG